MLSAFFAVLNTLFVSSDAQIRPGQNIAHWCFSFCFPLPLQWLVPLSCFLYFEGSPQLRKTTRLKYDKPLLAFLITNLPGSTQYKPPPPPPPPPFLGGGCSLGFPWLPSSGPEVHWVTPTRAAANWDTVTQPVSSFKLERQPTWLS